MYNLSLDLLTTSLKLIQSSALEWSISTIFNVITAIVKFKFIALLFSYWPIYIIIYSFSSLLLNSFGFAEYIFIFQVIS